MKFPDDFDESAYQDRRIVDMPFVEAERRIVAEGIYPKRLRPDIRIRGTITGRIVRNGRPPIEEVERFRGRPPIVEVDKEEQVKKLTRRQIAERMLAKYSEMIAQLEQLPDEPKAAENSPFPPAVFFVKKFPGSDQEYTYIYYKAPHNGRWYGTGAKQMLVSYSWDELMEWLENSGPMPTIYKLTGFEEYWAPEDDGE